MESAAGLFVYSCLREDGEAARLLLDSGFEDWDGVLRAATDEAVLPLLHSRILQLELTSRIPSELLEFLSAVENLNQERNNHIFEELKVVVRLLNEAGIEPVLLKGAAYIATGIYAGASTRYLCDIDLLVSEAQLPTAVEILARNGFVPESADPFGPFRHHYPPMRRPGSVYIELHHSLCLGNQGSLLPASQAIARSLPLDLDGGRVRIPCPEDLFTHLVLHSQILHPYNERIWPTARAMYDLVLLSRHYREVIDWKLIQRRFRNAGLFGVLALHLLQVKESLGLEPPFKFKLDGLMKLRWTRRRLLRMRPALRYGDPIYMCSAVLVRRLRVLRNMLGKPHGLAYLVKQLFSSGIYRHFAEDVFEGRGR
jgi:hypothetical protein